MHFGGCIETEVAWQSYVVIKLYLSWLVEIASLGLDTADKHRLLDQRSQ